MAEHGTPNSAMARFTGRSRLGTTVAAEAFSRIEPAVDAMPGQVIPPMGHDTTGIAVIFYRRLQPRARSVTIGAKTGLMTDRADPLTAHSGQTVIVPEQRGMLKSPKGKFMCFGIMTLGAPAQVSLFLGMPQGQVFTLGPAGTGQHGSSQKDDAQNNKKRACCDLGHVSPA
jgi:hypothetical protein